jgi:putative MATE family efflux protein
VKAAPAKPSIALSDARPIWRSLGIFLIPLMLSFVLQALSQSANSFYVGRLVGVAALAAVSAIFPITFFLVSFLIGLGNGSIVLIGQAFGAREDRKVKEIAGTSLALALLLGCTIGTLGAMFAYPLLGALGTPADIIAAAASYARIVFLTMPLVFAYLMYTSLLRGTGDTRTPFFVLIASTALTLLVTPFFIRGVFGHLAFGVNGAAVGNAVAQALSLGGLLVYLGRTRHPLAFDRDMLANLRLPPPLVVLIAKIGIPTSVNIMMVSLSEIAVLTFVNRFGSTAVAAYGAVTQVANFVQFPAISIGIATSIFGAQSIGAGRADRLGPILRSAVGLNYAIEGALIAIAYFFGSALISLFITLPATVAIAHNLLVIVLWSFVLFGHARIIAAIMTSSGTVLVPMLLNVFSIWGVEVPVAFVLMQHLGLAGIWYGWPAAYIVGLLLQLAYYQFAWKRKRIARLV